MKLTKYILMLLFIPVLSMAATVTRVLDGDTLDVMENHQTMRIRLIDIDAPEKSQPYGQKAKRFLTRLVKNAESITVKRHGKDRYGRTLANVYVKKCTSVCLTYWVNAEMVKNGYAWAYRYHGHTTNSTIADEEKKAQKNHYGLWRDKHAVEPWKWRQRNESH